MRKTIYSLPTRIKNALRGAQSPLSVAAGLRSSLPINQVTALAIATPQLAGKDSRLLPRRCPDSYLELFSAPRLSQVECDREIAWGLGLLLRDVERLSGYLEKKAKLESALLTGSWKAANSTLNDIEDSFGVSLWLLETRIAFLQLSEGLESQKVLSKHIADTCSRSITSVLAFFVSQRNEGTINPIRFVKQLDREFRASRLDPHLQDYLMFRLADSIPDSCQKIANVLWYELGSSIIDYYETFMRIALTAVCEDGCSQSPEFLRALQVLARFLDDHRIHRALFMLAKSDKALATGRLHDLTPFNKFAVGLNNDCALLSRAALLADGTDVAIAILHAHATADRPVMVDLQDLPKGIVSKVAHLAYHLIAKSSSFDEAYFEALRLSLNFRFCWFSANINSLALAEASCQPSYGRKRELFTLIHSPYLDLVGVRSVPRNVRLAYLRALQQRYGESPSVQIALDRSGFPEVTRQYDTGPAPYSQSIRDEIQIEDALDSSDWEKAIQITDSLIDSTSTRTRRRSLRYKSFALYKAGRFEELVRCIAANCVRDKGVVPMMPIELCAKQLDKTLRKRLSSDIALSIVFDLCSRHYSDDFDNFRSYAYEDFLRAHGVARPSELQAKESQFDRKLLVYYLRNLCIPEIMRISRAFKSSRDLENERLAVCASLIELDPSLASEYEAEIGVITRTQLIQRGIGQFERSKIFIDSAAIRRWADQELKESFARYQTLLRSGMDAGAEGFLDAMREAIRNLSTGIPIDRDVLDLPKNEASDLLVTVVSAFIRECLTSPQHGLDCYLSMQIRHGALSGQLRLPLEDEQIITQRDSMTLQYKRNEFWLQRMMHLNPQTSGKVDEALRSFSLAYDSFVDTIKDDLIQIRSKEKPSGLFVVELDKIILRGLATDITQDTTFDEFVELCFHVFWDSLEASLRAVRNAINQKVKPAMNQLFIDLEAQLADIDADGSLAQLNSSVRLAQTKAQGALDRVQEWFRAPKPLEGQRYSLEDLVDISLQYVKNIHRAFNPVLTKEIEHRKSFTQITIFMNIFFIIFDNINRHSGLLNPSVRVTATVDGDCLHINVRNTVDGAARIDASNVKVNKIRKAIAEGGYLAAVRSEGGTGLIKLHNIIRADLHLNNKLAFGYVKDNLFEVDLRIGVTHLLQDGGIA